MDIAEIERMLNQTNLDDGDIDEGDLDAELEAILSGRAPIRQARENSRASARVPEFLEQPRTREPPPDYQDDEAKLERELARFIGKLEPAVDEAPLPQPKPRPPPAPLQPAAPQAPRPAPMPPQTHINTPVPQPRPAAPHPPRPTASSIVIQSPPKQPPSRLEQLRDAYKREAIVAKKSGNMTDAVSHLRTAKTVEAMIEAERQGQTIDPSSVPPMPATNRPQATAAAASPVVAPVPAPSAAPIADIPEVEVDDDERKKLFNAPEQTGTLSDALRQRLDKYRSTQAQAETEGNSSKARRIGRIVKQYESAIKANRAGQPFEYEALPNPPGWDDLPLNAPAPQAPTPATAAAGPAKPKAPAPQPPGAAPPPGPAVGAAKTLPKPRAPQPPATSTMPGPKRQSSIANKQLSYLQKRQQMFKDAALEAKRNGDLNQAKEYLRQARGFDPLIEATRNGLPIDSTSIPTPPQLADDFVMVSKNVLGDGSTEIETGEVAGASQDQGQMMPGERDELFRKVELELTEQIEMCQKNRDYFLALGDVTSGSKFEKFSKDTTKDLDMLRAHWVNQDRLPKFHYEQRNFSIVICNTDLTVNEISVDIIKAINLPTKADIYCRVEFPFPSDAPPQVKTRTVKDQINPEFNETFKFDIDRKSRSLARIFKRHALKIEMWAKGSNSYFCCGFLRSDNLVGTVQIKLADFESKCQLHDGFAVMDGRKATSVKLEVKVRIREPLLSKQLEEIQAKWLVFDSVSKK